MTNVEMFVEIFGFKPDGILIENCPFPSEVCEAGGCLVAEKIENPFTHEEETIRSPVCDECTLKNWWRGEYKRCFKLREDLK